MGQHSRGAGVTGRITAERGIREYAHARSGLPWPGQKQWERVADLKIERPEDAIVRITTATICGTDLHILKGDVPEVTRGTVLGHEAVGKVEEAGGAVANLKKGAWR